MRSSSGVCSGAFLTGAGAAFLPLAAGFLAAGFLAGSFLADFLAGAFATFFADFFLAGLAAFLAGAVFLAWAFFLAAFRAKILLKSGGEI